MQQSGMSSLRYSDKQVGDGYWVTCVRGDGCPTLYRPERNGRVPKVFSLQHRDHSLLGWHPADDLGYHFMTFRPSIRGHERRLMRLEVYPSCPVHEQGSCSMSSGHKCPPLDLLVVTFAPRIPTKILTRTFRENNYLHQSMLFE